MNLAVHELLEQINDLKEKDFIINALRQYGNERLMEFFRFAFGSKEWDLPEGAPPYKTLQDPGSHDYFWKDIRILYIFLKNSTSLRKVEKEQKFILMLENIHPKDAELLIKVKDREWPYANITKDIVNEAFPNLIED